MENSSTFKADKQHFGFFLLASLGKTGYLQPMTVLKAHFDGKVLIPDEPVNLPTNCVLEVRVELVRKASANGNSLQSLAEVAQRFPVTDGPTDGAAQHDHYLYGVPKQS